jgi:thymidylate kinase
MIILIEGPRSSGKTHLIGELRNHIKMSNLKDDLDMEIVFYKYGFVEHIKSLNMEDQESGAGFHYFTISNTLTILELQKILIQDKVFIFDRGVFSAYAWSIFRKRLNEARLRNEIKSLLDNVLYSNCHIIYVTTEIPEKREAKDMFDSYENYEKENILFREIFKDNIKSITSSEKNNSLTYFENKMDRLSECLFSKTLINIIETHKI